MAQTVQKKRIVGNTGRRAGASRRRYKRASRSNVGEIVGFTLAAGNPGRKAGHKMAKKSHKKASSHSRKRGFAKSAYKRRRSNPGTGRMSHRRRTHHHIKRYKRHHSNPGAFGGLGSTALTGVFVIAGALGSKLGTQMVLGTNNTGLIGYVGNAAAGGILWGVARFFKASRPITDGLLYGTIVQIILRAINDYTPFGSYVAQLGMGDYQMQSFVTPQVLVDPWRDAEISIPDGWAPKMIAAAPPAAGNGRTPPGAAVSPAPKGPGMAGLYGGGWGGGLYG